MIGISDDGTYRVSDAAGHEAGSTADPDEAIRLALDAPEIIALRPGQGVMVGSVILTFEEAGAFSLNVSARVRSGTTGVNVTVRTAGQPPVSLRVSSTGAAEALRRRHENYAIKFAIESDAEPTDANLAACLDHCVRPARPAEYPAIRIEVARYRRGEMPGC